MNFFLCVFSLVFGPNSNSDMDEDMGFDELCMIDAECWVLVML